MDVRVGKRAQVVIPAILRRQMGVQDGDRLHVELDDRGRLILEKVAVDPLDRFLQAGQGLDYGDPVEFQRSVRAEWDDRAAP